jgi:prolyl-tRNA editing enzyme YbaK/EbsC (Cys-tRNA(Pro) deacylase)
MSGAWPEQVERVTAFLREAGAEARIEEFPSGTPTARDAARAVGCELSRIVKSLVFEADGAVVLALVPGDRRAAAEKVAAAVGVPGVSIATAERVRALTGFDPGAVCPFPAPASATVLIERTLLGADRVWVGAGSARHMAGIAPAELVRLTRAAPRDIVADD